MIQILEAGFFLNKNVRCGSKPYLNMQCPGDVMFNRRLFIFYAHIPSENMTDSLEDKETRQQTNYLAQLRMSWRSNDRLTEEHSTDNDKPAREQTQLDRLEENFFQMLIAQENTSVAHTNNDDSKKT